MGIDDAAQAARDRLDMVNRSAEALERIDEISPRDPDVCDQVGADCRDCEEVLYHPHERQPLSEIEAKKILWELGQLAIDSAGVGRTDLRDRDRLQALMAKAAKRIGHIVNRTE